jgi:hypothetical protein
MSGEQSADGTERYEVVAIRECTRCGKTGDDSEEYGVQGVPQISGNLCAECARELDAGTKQ